MRRKLLIRNAALWVACIGLSACSGNNSTNNDPPPPPPPVTENYKEPLMEVNKHVAKDEALQIENYIKRHGMTVTKSSTGLRYQIYKKGPANGPMPKREQMAFIHFTAYLLNGKEVYTSRGGAPVSIIIDHDDVESGLHEGLKYMHVGDKAKFILPSHLAHGLTGDNNKIPPLTPVVYDIELISIK